MEKVLDVPACANDAAVPWVRGVDAGSSGVWLACLSPQRQPVVRLVCFPHAGGTILTYQAWIKPLEALLPGTEVWTVQLADGQLPAYHEVVPQLTAALLADIEDREERPSPIAFFGHSLGGLLAFGVARCVRARYHESLLGLIVTGMSAPTALHGSDFAAPFQWDLDDWRRCLRSVGGVTQEVLEAPTVLQELSEQLKNQLTLGYTYYYIPAPPFPFPISVHTGAYDKSELLPNNTVDWGKETSVEFNQRVWPGGHFFFHEADIRQKFLQTIGEDLRRWLSMTSRR